MRTDLVVLKPGTKVTLGDRGYIGIIVRVIIAPGNYVQYEVSWWEDATKHQTVIEECEVEPTGDSESEYRVGMK